MAATCPIDFDVRALRESVRSTYAAVARDPSGDFHFHRGARYAVEQLGYDATELDALPARATSRFAGVGNPLSLGPIRAGETVLDHACGAGTDLLLAARRVGASGRAIGVDMTDEMREQARRAVEEAGLADRVEVRAGMFEALPVDDESVDVVVSNGVLNLAPDKRVVLAEIHRVLRPGGRLYLADVVVARELKLEARRDPVLWAACIGGALPQFELATLAAEAGLVSGLVQGWVASFAGTSAEAKVATDLRVGATHFTAEKPLRRS